MYRKNKKMVKIKYILIAFLAVILIFVSIIFIKDERKLNFIEKATKDGILFIGNIVLTPANFIKDKIVEYNEKDDLYNKYIELENKVNSYNTLLAEKKELEYEIEELKQVLEINNLLSEKKVMNAVVVNRNLDYWHDTITIDKGSHDGVEEGMPVVVNEGLVGKITSVSNFNSTVKLMTSPTNSKISIKIENGEEYVYGLLTCYDAKNNLYKIEGISHTINVSEGSLVTTTGLGDIFPSGLVIGHVKSAKADNYDLAQIIEVKPSVDFDYFSVVTIIKRNVDQ